MTYFVKAGQYELDDYMTKHEIVIKLNLELLELL